MVSLILSWDSFSCGGGFLTHSHWSVLTEYRKGTLWRSTEFSTSILNSPLPCEGQHLCISTYYLHIFLLTCFQLNTRRPACLPSLFCSLDSFCGIKLGPEDSPHLFVCFYCTGGWHWDLTYPMQVLYHWAPSPFPFISLLLNIGYHCSLVQVIQYHENCYFMHFAWV